MKHIKTFENKIEQGWHGNRFVTKRTKSGINYDVPVYTHQELESKKSDMLESFKKDPEMQHLSEEDMIKMIGVFYKLEIKHGEIIID